MLLTAESSVAVPPLKRLASVPFGTEFGVQLTGLLQLPVAAFQSSAEAVRRRAKVSAARSRRPRCDRGDEGRKGSFWKLIVVGSWSAIFAQNSGETGVIVWGWRTVRFSRLACGNTRFISCRMIIIRPRRIVPAFDWLRRNAHPVAGVSRWPGARPRVPAASSGARASRRGQGGPAPSPRWWARARGRLRQSRRRNHSRKNR